MTKTVDFYFDFASPNAYLSHKALAPIKERTGATVNTFQFYWEEYSKLLGTNHPWSSSLESKERMNTSL